MVFWGVLCGVSGVFSSPLLCSVVCIFVCVVVFVSEFTDALSGFVSGCVEGCPPPLMGVVGSVSNDLRFCGVVTDVGTLVDVPCHGLPVVGDSVIVHFIGGNYEQPVADCARRLPAGSSTVDDYLLSECFNYHVNGDFSSGVDGYSGDFSLCGDDSYTLTGDACALLDVAGKSLSFRVDLSDCGVDCFKFQCYYKGCGSLTVRCVDGVSGSPVMTLPLNTSSSYRVWTGESGGRWSWNYNKEVYSMVLDGSRLEEVVFSVSNSSTVSREVVGDVVYESRTAMLVDGLLVYDEDNDTNFYQNVNDVRL